MQPCVYILASCRNGTLYTGVTNNIARRLCEHKAGAIKSFTSKYKVDRLVYLEFYDTMEDAIIREKRIKKWKRAWKLELIEKNNPQWCDLYDQVLA